MQPRYISYENKEREEFLSQIGNFTPGERDVFYKLCQNWQSRIPYERFTRMLNSESGGNAGDLTSLLTKLRKDGWGLLRTRIVDGNRSREAVILTDQHSPRFFAELVDEYFTDMMESIVNPLPLKSYVEKTYGPVPPEAVRPIPANQLATVLTSEDSPTEEEGDRDEDAAKALSVQSLNNDSLLITQKNLRAFLNVAILKLRYYLSNTTLLGLLAKLQDTSLLALKKGVGGKDSPFWLALTKSVVTHHREIEALRNVSVDANFYHAAWLLKNLIESQLTEAEERKKRQEEENLDLDAIALAVKEAPEKILDQDELTSIINTQAEKYGDQIEQFRDRFYERYVKDKAGSKLPRVVIINSRYIHRDNIFPLFLEKFRVAEMELRPFFVQLMERQLRSGNRSRDETFFTVENFEEAILDQVRVQSVFLADVIKKPAILAEGMIHYLKLNKLVKDVDELKQRLALYFDPGSMNPLPLNQWFNLRLVEIFEQAFERLPIWQRIWIRLTGKYESFRSRFVGQGAATATMHTGVVASVSERKKADRRSSQQDKRETRRGRRKSGESPRKGRPAAAARSSSGGSTDAAKRAMNPKQVDSAWEQFGSTLKKND